MVQRREESLRQAGKHEIEKEQIDIHSRNDVQMSSSGKLRVTLLAKLRERDTCGEKGIYSLGHVV